MKNLRVFRIDAPRNLIYVRGAVPGFAGNWLRIRDAARKKLPARSKGDDDDVGANVGDDVVGELVGLGISEWQPKKLVEG